MKFIKYLFIFIIIGIVIGSIVALSKYYLNIFKTPQINYSSSSIFISNDSSNLNTYKNQYYQNEFKDIYLVVFNSPLDLYYNPANSLGLTNLSKKIGDDLLINGGYFREDRSYGGLLVIKGEVISNLIRNNVQASAVGVYDNLSDKLNFFENLDFKPSAYLSARYTMFQAGPLIVNHNQINNRSIDLSLNGKGRYLRTLLGYTESGKKFFVVTDSPYDLKTLSEEILKFNIFKNEIINILNLDGGSSTAMYSSENSSFNIFNEKLLPILIGAKAK